MKQRALVVGGLALAVAAGIVLAIRASGKADAGGFLGPGPLLADVNLLLEILLVLGLTVGMRLARSGNIEAHRVNQTAWVLVNTALVAFVMVSAMASFKIASFKALADVGNAVTVIHGLVGTFTFLSGIWLVLQMNDVLPPQWHVKHWKALMRITLAGYWTVAALGIVTYYYWYAA